MGSVPSGPYIGDMRNFKTGMLILVDVCTSYEKVPRNHRFRGYLKCGKGPDDHTKGPHF